MLPRKGTTCSPRQAVVAAGLARLRAPARGAPAPCSRSGTTAGPRTFTPGPPGRWSFTIEALAGPLPELGLRAGAQGGGGPRRAERALEGAALLRACAARADAAHATHDAQLLDEAASVPEGPPMDGIGRATDGARSIGAAPATADRSIAPARPARAPGAGGARPCPRGRLVRALPAGAPPNAERHGTFRDAEQPCSRTIERRWASTSCTSRPSTPSADTARKGKNNARRPAAGDVGSPWAIGGRRGRPRPPSTRAGHGGGLPPPRARAPPSTGWRWRWISRSRSSPDHPWMRRASGVVPAPARTATIKTAENPPKRYDDIVNFDFLGPGRAHALAGAPGRGALLGHPGCAPLPASTIPTPSRLPSGSGSSAEARERDPRLVFLSGGLHPPADSAPSAKAGFSQSYTYFTWRNGKRELTDYFRSCAAPAWADAVRPNLWPNTPDILPEFLQRGGPPAFRIRDGAGRPRSGAVVGHLLRLRVLRRRGAPGRGVPRQREVPAGGLAGPALRLISGPWIRTPQRDPRSAGARAAARRRPEFFECDDRPGALPRQAHRGRRAARCWWR